MSRMSRTLIAVGCLSAIAACDAAEPTGPAPPRLARIETAAPAQTSARREFVGEVEARRTVDMAFQVGGRLNEMPVSEGQDVDQGAMIAELDLQPFERALREAEVQLQQARQNRDRQRTLRARGIASEAALEDAETAYELRVVARDAAAENLGYATLTAPFRGLVSRRLVDNYSTVAAGQAVLRLQDVSELRVAISLPESMIALFDEDDARDVSARFAFLPDQSFPLEYREIIAEADESARTYTVLMALPPDIPANILPGMSVTVGATLGEHAPGTGARVPLSALASTPEGGFAVWVYDEASGAVSRRSVETSPPHGDTVVVRAGLEPGEPIVTAGVGALSEGMRVTPMASVAAAASRATDQR